jgi:hypothetical protein
MIAQSCVLLRSRCPNRDNRSKSSEVASPCSAPPNFVCGFLKFYQQFRGKWRTTRKKQTSSKITELCKLKSTCILTGYTWKNRSQYFNTCTVHLLLFCTMTNKCTIISQIITLLHVLTLSCHPRAACNQYLAKSHKYFKCSCW